MPGFLDLPQELARPETAAVHVLPVPYEATSTWRKGTDRGPQAILEASAAVEWYDLETDSEPCRRGIATRPAPAVAGLAVEAMCGLVQEAVGAILERGALPLVLGGEHSVSIGAMRAAAGRFPPLSILQLDAHADSRESYRGSTHNHACVMARARELGPVVQVGIRSLDASERQRLDPDRVFFAHEIATAADEGWMDRVVGGLTERVYLTVDLDGFDPSLVPATGTPEPGGLDWYTVNRLLAWVAARRHIVGFDVVELCPAPGHHASAFLAAKLAYRVIAMVLESRPASG